MMKKLSFIFFNLLFLSISCSKRSSTESKPLPISNDEQVTIQTSEMRQITELIQYTDLGSRNFSNVRKLYDKEVSRIDFKHVSKKDIEILSSIIKMVHGKNHFEILCKLYSENSCLNVATGIDFIKNVKVTFSESNAFLGVIYELIAFDLVDEEQKNNFFNDIITYSSVSKRLIHFSSEQGENSQTISNVLILYSEFLSSLNNESLFKVLNKFVENYKINSIKIINGEEDHFEKYLSLLLEKIEADESIISLNENQLTFIEIFYERVKDEELRKQIADLFFMSSERLESQVHIKSFIHFLDKVMYEEMKVPSTTLLSEYLSIPFLTDEAKVNSIYKRVKERLNTDHSDRSFEYRMNLLEVQKLKFELKTDKSNQLSTKFLDAFTRALNSYYNSEYSSLDVYSFNSQNLNTIFSIQNNNGGDVDTVFVMFKDLFIMHPGVYGAKSSHLDITFAEGVLSHPLSLIYTNGKTIKVASHYILGLNIYTTPTYLDVGVTDTESILKEKYYPLLPKQFIRNIHLDSRYDNQNHKFNKSCSLGGPNIVGHVTGAIEYGIENERYLDFVTNPIIDLNGKRGREAGEISVIAEEGEYLVLMANGEKGDDGQNNVAYHFDSGVIEKRFEKKFKLECEKTDMYCYESRGRDCTFKSNVDIESEILVAFLKQPAPGIGGNGGDGADIVIQGKFRNTLTTNFGGPSGISGLNIADELIYDNFLSIDDPSLYSPAYSVKDYQSKVRDGLNGSLVINDN